MHNHWKDCPCIIFTPLRGDAIGLSTPPKSTSNFCCYCWFLFAVISKSFYIFSLGLQIDLGLLCIPGQCSISLLPSSWGHCLFIFLYTIEGIVNYPMLIVFDTWILNLNAKMTCSVFLAAFDSFFYISFRYCWFSLVKDIRDCLPWSSQLIMNIEV